MTPIPWPYHPSDVDDSAHIAIPNQLERFLVGLLTGDPDNKIQSHRVTTLVESFSQDMIYAVTRGQHKQHKPPKHILLPYTVKALTGNIEIIRTLNKFGHGVSYDQLEENDTQGFPLTFFSLAGRASKPDFSLARKPFHSPVCFFKYF